MNPVLQRYLRAVDKQLARRTRLTRDERGAMMTEIRDHLLAEVGRRQSEEALDETQAVHAAVAAFGEPDEIAVAYEGGGAVVNRTTGERLLEVAVLTGRAAGRGAGRVLTWVGILLIVLVGAGAVLILASLLFAGTFLAVFEDEIKEAVPHPVYDRAEERETADAMSGLERDTFTIPDRADEVRVLFDVEPDAGCLGITLIDPQGGMHELNGNGCEEAGAHRVLAAIPGTWEVQYRAVLFVGSFEVHVVYHVASR